MLFPWGYLIHHTKLKSYDERFGSVGLIFIMLKLLIMTPLTRLFLSQSDSNTATSYFVSSLFIFSASKFTNLFGSWQGRQRQDLFPAFLNWEFSKAGNGETYPTYPAFKGFLSGGKYHWYQYLWGVWDMSCSKSKFSLSVNPRLVSTDFKSSSYWNGKVKVDK